MAGDNAYWSRRALKDKAKSVNRTEKYIRTEQKKLYSKVSKEIREEIEKLYQGFASQENITLAEAKKYIKAADFKKTDWNGMIEESLRMRKQLKEARELPDAVVDIITKQHEKLEREIRAYSKRGRISYLELRSLEIDKTLVSLYDSQQISMYDLLANEWEEEYYRSIYNTQQHIGFGKDFVSPNKKVIERAVLNTIDKKNYSRRLYKHCEDFSRDLKENLITGLIRGESLDKMASRLHKRMDVSYSRARTLVRSETAYLFESATMAGYEQCGIDWYEFMATLDKWTSEICQNLDGQHFKVKDAVPGKNYPPMHPNCRSTTVCYFPEEKLKETRRIAKDLGGKYYMVPSSMTYKQWKEKHAAQTDMKDVRRAVKKEIIKHLNKTTELKTPIGLMDIPYARTVRHTVENSSSEAARLLKNHYEEIKISNTKVYGGAHYSPGSRVIRYNAEKDYRNIRGKFATLFHECGHMVDDLTGNLSELALFKQALTEDSEKYFADLQQAYGYATMEEVYAHLRMKKDVSIYHGVLDILDGISGKRILKSGGHAKEYWEKEHMLEHEAYAHFFSASILENGEKLALIREVFPDAFKLFEEVIRYDNRRTAGKG